MGLLGRVWPCAAVILVLGLLAPSEARAQQVKVTLVIHQPGSAPTYPVQGPAGMTVEQVMQKAGIKYTVAFFPNVGGYALLQVGTVPTQTNGAFSSPFWWLCVNGLSAQLGMSAQTVADGDEVAWFYTKDSKCPKDPAGAKH